MHHADVVELVDTLDSGSSAREGMKVQVLSSALKARRLIRRVFLLGFLKKFIFKNLAATHRAVSSLKVVKTSSIHHFSFLPALGFAQIFFTKAIF